ncbi:hypothetical protein AYO40_05810 [Planctomycetaceae bacterium SCGC AG-212-D15]|nr:hypothetical protein AYO40_05810 [Planctomycetaceae bacterium SCGC AG-212-D15]
MVRRLPSNSGIDVGCLLANAARATNEESLLLDSLFCIIGAEQYASEFFKGAHVVIEADGGRYYNCWRHLAKEPRPSSHDSDDLQYEVAGPCCHAVLFGILFGKTWFQMENHSYGENKILHGKDWVEYKITTRNQGPYGSSIYTDDHWLSIQGLADDDD